MKVNVEEMRRAVASAIPFAGTNDTLPVLNAVLVSASGHTLTLSTTDRYVAAVVTAAADTDGPTGEWVALIPLTDMKGSLLPALKRNTKLGGHAEMTILVEQGDGAPKMVIEFPLTGERLVFAGREETFPKLASLWPTESAEIGTIGFNAAYLAKFAPVAKELGGKYAPPMRLQFGPRATSPVRVDFPGHPEFKGLIMPVRLEERS